MKTIGLIGGLSWESTMSYYKILNETIKERLGGLHSAKCLLYSVDFQEIEECQARGDWERSGRILADAAVRLEKAGADFLLICSNTMHKVAAQVEAAVRIPLIHIADATVLTLKENGIGTVGLLGTKYTMTQDFYRSRVTGSGLGVLIPDTGTIERINAIIYNELCLGILSEESRREFLRVIGDLSTDGAQGVILGCTEIGLLVGQSDTPVRLFDTTSIHATHAALLAIDPTV